MSVQAIPVESVVGFSASAETPCPLPGAVGLHATQEPASGACPPHQPAQPRLRTADRQQLLPPRTIDDLIESDHPARAVWRFAEALDLSTLYDRIRARGSVAGRSAIDPRVLVALWLYATLAGVTSARALADLCLRHDTYRWLAGGIAVNAHTLSDFRVQDLTFLESMFKHSVNALLQPGVIDLDRVAQDGIRVRASAGAASFRRRETLQKALQEAQAEVARLQEQPPSSAAATGEQTVATGEEPSAPRRAAAFRHATQRVERIQRALTRMTELEAKKALAEKEPQKKVEEPKVEEPKVEEPKVEEPKVERKAEEPKSAEEKAAAKAATKKAKKKATRQKKALAKQARQKAAKAKRAEKKAAKQKANEKELRVSTTDAEATVMKMGDGGYRPAYNIQFSTTCGSQVIVGVEVVTVGNDQGQLPPMVEQIEERFEQVPKEALVDGGYVNHADIKEVQGEKGCKVYGPVPKSRKEGVDCHAPKAKDSAEVAEWRVRMGTAEAKEIYKERAATAECVNAQARNRGLVRLVVRGLEKVKAIAFWLATVHNMVRAFSLLPQPAATG